MIGGTESEGFTVEPTVTGGLAGWVSWPPWLENLTDRERIHAIVWAVVACHESHRGHDDAEAHEQHCSATMAEEFLAKLLAAETDRAERAFAGGWQHSALALAKDFDDLGYTEAAALAREAAGASGARL